ncbi:MAG: prefoldin subunit beta [Candidatus Bathyarchaeia archaeon]
MSEESLPPALQEQIARFQQLQETLQAIVVQKQQLELELMGVDRAIAELQKLTDDATVYKSVGSLLLKSNRQALLTELNERRELLNMRVSVLGKQEERARERAKEAQQKLQERLRGVTPQA